MVCVNHGRETKHPAAGSAGLAPYFYAVTFGRRLSTLPLNSGKGAFLQPFTEASRETRNRLQKILGCSIRHTAKRLSQLQQPAANNGISDTVIPVHQFQSFATRTWARRQLFRTVVALFPSPLVFVNRHLANNLLKGKAEWNIKNAAELIKPVGTALISRDLLECQFNLVSKVFLEQPKQGPANPGPFADTDVNWAGNAAAAGF